MAEGNGVAQPIIDQPRLGVQPHEQQPADFIVRDAFLKLTGKAPPEVAGYFVLLRIFQREVAKEITMPDGSKQNIFLSDRTITEDKYQSMVGLVLALGPQAYRGTNFDGTPRFPDGPWIYPGDWCVVPRYEGYQLSLKHKDDTGYTPLLIVPDDKILAKVEDPTDVIATHLLDR